MGYALTAGKGWFMGYRYVAVIQIVLSVILFLSIPKWKTRQGTGQQETAQAKALSIREILSIPGAKEVLIAFFCYCAAEQTAILWSSTYLVKHNGMDETAAAAFGSLYLLGLTAGRALSGFLTMKLNDTNMIRLGQALMVLGVLVMLLPFGAGATMVGLMLNGLGCAPVYPCIIHSTPDHFGAENSQALIGVQMACAYMGILAMPPVFGLIAEHISASLLPLFLAVIIGTMILMCEKLNRKTAR